MLLKNIVIGGGPHPPAECSVGLVAEVKELQCQRSSQTDEFDVGLLGVLAALAAVRRRQRAVDLQAPLLVADHNSRAD